MKTALGAGGGQDKGQGVEVGNVETETAGGEGFFPFSSHSAVVALAVVVVTVPLVLRLITGPNVCPASVDTLITDSFVCGCTFSFSSHHVTYTRCFLQLVSLQFATECLGNCLS